MVTAALAGLCRVTIVAPRTRVDLALPEELVLAELLPAMLGHAGEDLAEAGPGGWALTRLGAAPLDTSRTLAQLAVRDGEQLYLTPRGAVPPAAVYDDVVDAVAAARAARLGRWKPTTSRLVAVVTATVALLGGSGVLALAGPPGLPAALAALVTAVTLLLAGTAFSRAGGDGATGALLGLLALPYGLVGGLLLVAGERGLAQLAAPHVLVGAAMTLLVAAGAALGVAAWAPLFLAAGAAAVVLALGALLVVLFGTTPAGAAAVVAAGALGVTPLLPLWAVRLARLPLPSIPSRPEELRHDDETVDAARVLRASEELERHLFGLLLATGVVGLVAVAVLLHSGGVVAAVLAGVVTSVLLLRARVFLGVAQRLPLLVAGLVGVGLLAAAGVTASAPVGRLGLVFPSLVGVATVGLGYGLFGVDRRLNPVWGRLLDVTEALLVVAVVPLTLAVCDLYGWVRALPG